MLNKILPPYDNTIKINFQFSGEFQTNGLSNFDEITLTIGTESYSSIINPDELRILSNSQIEINISDSTNLPAGNYIPEIIGYNNKYEDGYILNSECENKLKYPVQVIRC